MAFLDLYKPTQFFQLQPSGSVCLLHSLWCLAKRTLLWGMFLLVSLFCIPEEAPKMGEPTPCTATGAGFWERTLLGLRQQLSQFCWRKNARVTLCALTSALTLSISHQLFLYHRKHTQFR